MKLLKLQISTGKNNLQQNSFLICVFSRNQIVLSGTEKGVEYAGSIINTRGFAGRAVKLPVSAPFHCSLMTPAQEKMKVALDRISFNEPKIEVISNVTGMPVNYT